MGRASLRYTSIVKTTRLLTRGGTDVPRGALWLFDMLGGRLGGRLRLTRARGGAAGAGPEARVPAAKQWTATTTAATVSATRGHAPG